jgi:hypothetical protein
MELLGLPVLMMGNVASDDRKYQMSTGISVPPCVRAGGRAVQTAPVLVGAEVKNSHSGPPAS